MKRLFDLIFGVVILALLVMPMFLIYVAVRLTSKGPAIYWSDRVGKDNSIFKMPKFRSMLIGTPVVATHLLDDSNSYLSPIGEFLRSSSLDEVPQLFSVIKGDMSLVGPRPALFNQSTLINLRRLRGVDKLLPGITGWAQINGRDELTISEKVDLDMEYLEMHTLWFDIKILIVTLIKVIKSTNMAH
jgi:O-antigen biosynthesis protein WbqP